MQLDERTHLAFIDGFIKPPPRQAHGTAHAAYVMCQAMAQYGHYAALHVYRERPSGAKADQGEFTLPRTPPASSFDKSALYSTRERYAAIYVANGSQMSSAPHVLRPANDWAPVICSIGTAHACSQWANLFVSLAAGAIRPGDGIIFKSQSVARLFRQTWETWRQRFQFVPPFPGLTAVIPNGVDVEVNRRSEALRREMRQQLRVEEDDVLFLSFSRLSPATKGDQQALIVRWKDVIARVPKATLLLSGAVVDRPFVADLRALARAADVSARVLVIDNPFELAADARNRLMSAADVFIHLSTGLEEASPLVVHEAMAHGLPVIATSWAGMPDTIVPGETGFLVETRNAPLSPSLAQTVFGQSDLVHLTAASRVVSSYWPAFVEAAQLLGASGRRQTMGAAARRAAEAGALPKVAGEYERFFAAASKESERTWAGAAPCRPLVDLDQMISAQATRPLDPEVRIRLADVSRARLLSSGLYTEVPAPVTRVLEAFEGKGDLTVAEIGAAFARGAGDREQVPPAGGPDAAVLARERAAVGRLLVRLLNFGVLEYL